MRTIPAIAALAAALALFGCGSSEPAGGGSAAGEAGGAQADARLNLAQGPDVCFRKVAEELGPNTKVADINSMFSLGSDMDSAATAPAGELTICTVNYQDPANPRKLVRKTLDVATGEFGEAQPVEITVMGNPADFNLEESLIPLSQVNAGNLPGIMEQVKPQLQGVYSDYRWNMVRLMAPGPFAETHELRLDLEGRLTANDVKTSGFATISPDGTTLRDNNLLPS